jgi:hypothetical protein
MQVPSKACIALANSYLNVDQLEDQPTPTPLPNLGNHLALTLATIRRCLGLSLPAIAHPVCHNVDCQHILYKIRNMSDQLNILKTLLDAQNTGWIGS